jgi:hypothetical protein
MSLVIQPKHPWATPEVWAAHRELISSLYWDQDKSLKEVQGFMIREHQFHATYVLAYLLGCRSWCMYHSVESDSLIQGPNVQKPIQGLGVDQAS